MTIISKHIYDPATALFKPEKNARGECRTIDCSLEECSLRDMGTCMMSGVLGSTKCEYGTGRSEVGFTKRARKHFTWIQERKEKYKDIPTLKAPARKLAFVGDYVYLPYAHMTMCKKVPFISHDAYIMSGTCLIHREDWNIENVLKLLDFVPMAMMGGSIRAYQRDQVPLFLSHLRETDEGMWQQLIAERPELDNEPDYVGRKALLKTLNFPISWETKGNNYPASWKWDGETLTTKSDNVYNSTWGQLKLDEITLTGKPKENSELVVQDNSWVNEKTVFVD